MVTISPFKALRPAAELAKQVASRPYDVHQDWLNRRVEITIYKKK